MLEINKFNKIIAANWKLNGSLDFIQGYFKNLHLNISFNPNICGIICLPAIYLHNSAKYLPPFFPVITFLFLPFINFISGILINENILIKVN